MFSLRYSSTLALIFTAVSALENGVEVTKRSPTLEGRKTCANPSFIPACPGFFACVPPGAICCDDNITYVMPPRSCPDGTQAITTAGVTDPEPTTNVVPSSITTPPPVATQTMGQTNFVYFTYEITWYYYYYYYTYIHLSTALTSSQITTITTVSVQATDSAQATLLLSSLSKTLAFPTPTQTATAVSGTPVAPTTIPLVTATSSLVVSNATTAVPSASAPVQFTGGATRMGGDFGVGYGLVMGGFAVVSGLLMVVL